MTEFVIAFAVFLALHSVPAIPAIRGRLIATLGRRLYLGLYSLASIAAIVWLFYAALRMDYVELWEPAPWQAMVTLVAAPVGVFFVLAGLFSGNPFSITLRSGEAPAGAIVAITRHPVLWGFSFWALGHLVPNGDLRSLLLFGGLALFSVAGFFMLDRRARRRLPGDWRGQTATAPLLPFAAILAGRAPLRIDRETVAAFVLTALITLWLLAGGHLFLFSADPLLLAGS